MPGIDWETCQTMQLPNNWGYNRLVGFRPFNDLLKQLIDVASKGGNMLLNVGPTAEGEILPQAKQSLVKFAAWMKVNKEAIHGTSASPFEWLPFDGRCTQKPGKLFLHVFKWPADGRLTVPMTNKVKRAYLLARPNQDLLVTQTAKGTQIALPALAPDPIASVLVVETDSPIVRVPAPKNLALGKTVTVSGEWKGREKQLSKDFVNDGDFGTMWAGPGETVRDGWVQIDFDAGTEISSALLDDHSYNRIQKYDLQALLDGQWKTLASGTTIGSHKREFFASVKARSFRLVIHESTDTPTLNEFQLFGE
jgi:alpha-L-fucosidase